MPSTRRKSKRHVKESDSEEITPVDEMQVDDLIDQEIPSPTMRPLAEPTIDESQLETDKTLVEFLQNMDDYQPIIPDAVLDHYFSKAGFDCPDVRMYDPLNALHGDYRKRFLGLAAQKFVSDIAQDAYQYCKIRQQGMSSKDKKAASKKTVLTMDDLSSALTEYGVNTKRPDYYT